MLKGRSFTKETDLTPAEWLAVLDLAAQLKAERRERREVKRLVGKKVALLFEKTSTRTSCSFDVAMTEQGGYATASTRPGRSSSTRSRLPTRPACSAAGTTASSTAVSPRKPSRPWVGMPGFPSTTA